MASFNSAASVFPRQAVFASATLPPQTPVPSFFGGNTATASPATPVANTPATPVVTPPAPPADTFTPTAPAPVATTAPAETPQTSTALAPNTATAPEATDAQKAEDAKKENGFMKFAKSPIGIGAGVVVGGLGIWAGVNAFKGGNTSIAKLGKLVKDLSQDGLDDTSKNTLLEQYAGHLRALTSKDANHTEATWEKLSSAIEHVHAKHGTDEIAQVRLLEGLGDTHPSDLKSLSGSAQQAIQETSESFVEGLGKKMIKAEEGAFYVAPLQNAVKWLVHPHGDESFGIKDEASLLNTAKNIIEALGKVDPEQNHLPALHKSLSAFTLSNKDFPVAKKGDTLPEVDLTQITDVISAGTQLYNARLKGKVSTKEVLEALNTKGIGEGYDALSKPNGFKELQALLLPKPESEEKKFPQRVLSFFPDVIFSPENRQKSEVFRIGRFVRDTWNNVTTKKTTE
jgi:hypothetical protein